MNVRRDAIDDAHLGTCDWLFRTDEFIEWRKRCDLRNHNGVLWIKGKPGVGKSTLMSHTLSHCERSPGDHLIAAYFFNARGAALEKTPMGMMRSIVYQLLKKDDTLYGLFLDRYREKQGTDGKKVQWGQPELKKFVRSIVKQPQSRSLLLLVDALDECDEEEARGVVEFLENLSVDATDSGVELRICLSSRHYPHISMRKNLELIVERREGHTTDIAAYVREKLHTKNRSIRCQIQKKADGIFMWVVLVVAMLNKADDEGRDEAIQKTLDEIPGELEELFRTILEKSDSDRMELVRMLQWVLFAKQPLAPKELYLVAVDKSLASYDAIRRRINNSSRGLLEIRKEEWDKEFVQFIHSSVIDFLHRNKRLETLDPTLQPDPISASHARLWASCRSCIESLVASRKPRWKAYAVPLGGYAMNYILYHADQALSGDKISFSLEYEMKQWLAARISWAQLIVPDDALPKDTQLTCEIVGADSRNLLRFAFDKDVNLNIQLTNTDKLNTLLVLAGGRGDCEILQILINGNIDVDGEGVRRSPTALFAASCGGHYEAVKLLIANGADVNTECELHESDTTLRAASLVGFYKIVRLRVKHIRPFGSAIHAASFRNFHEVAQLLLANGADVNKQSEPYGTALQAASICGSYEVAQLLVKAGANVNARGGAYSSALEAAIQCIYSQGARKRHHRDRIAQLLLENGAECTPSVLEEYSAITQEEGRSMDWMALARAGSCI
ncbi:ankyrin repeat-containing domain protein [Nemania sp. NC0429]|nr:ankyrin repeat-containing domain protein [Nemania sp. NC0429]